LKISYTTSSFVRGTRQLKHRLRPMRGLRSDRTAQTVIAGQAFMQNLRRGHYELAVDAPGAQRVAVAFAELARAI
jgi:IS6 family transposase